MKAPIIRETGPAAQRFEPGNSAMALLHCIHSSKGRNPLSGADFYQTIRTNILQMAIQIEFPIPFAG
jgi:hypothetical protein